MSPRQSPLHKFSRGPVSTTTYIVSTHDAVEELNTARQNEECHEDVDELGSLRRMALVVVVDIHDDSIPGLSATRCLGGALAGLGSNGCWCRRWGRRDVARVALGRHCVTI